MTAELDESHLGPTFAELGVRDEIVRALAEIGIDRTFAIQELTLPLALAGEDLIGQARTGMGKTFGFGVPLLHRLATADTGTTPLDGTPRALIIVPTRELCIQVTSDLVNAAKYLKNHQGSLKVASIYGGRPYDTQIAALRAGVDVVVGTPGRLLDLANQNHLILGKVGVLVLDEADEMLDLGFLPDIERILTMVPDKRQTMLFSATMPGPIITLARTFLTKPTHIRAEEAHASSVHDRTTQFVYRAHALDKSELVAKILQAESRGATMIFTRTKRTAQKVADELADRGFAVGAVHGDLGQIAREKALTKFRTGKIDVLVATDVAARGIDIDDVTHVINYQCPEDEKTYVHRIGRTGRAGRTGVAVTLIDWDELNRWAGIDKALGLGIPEPVETYSRSPHLFTDLGIPADATGQVRKAKPARDEDAVVVEREPRAPRKRNRRRTLRGQPLDEAAENGTGNEETAAAEPVSDDTAAPTRRRRRRGKSSGDAEAATSNGDTSAVTSNGDTEAMVESVDAGSDSADQPARRRRRRRKPAGEGAAAEVTEATGTELVSAEVAPEEKPARRRTRKAADAETTHNGDGKRADTEAADTGAGNTTVAQAAGSGVSEATTAHSAGTSDLEATAAKATDNGDSTTASETASQGDGEPAEAPVKRRRTRKPAADTTDNGESTATAAQATSNGDSTATLDETANQGDGEPAEAPVKRQRTRKPAADTTSNGDSTATVGETASQGDGEPAEAPVKRRRTRKPAAEATAENGSVNAENGAAEADSEEKPVRARRRRKPAEESADNGAVARSGATTSA
ncbi:hypothetical protein GCM10027088_17390 [Nocardia goodfellowii]|uniref:Superfamily II DNA/RNA helicase n=1 Tax=Nocardia goodfellowii TaxID=882446 RepID=A0ABS4QFK1_9NOCA|nr:superfamily II DNA/RNA helicase [Nocardia goodfellowii]